MEYNIPWLLHVKVSRLDRPFSWVYNRFVQQETFIVVRIKKEFRETNPKRMNCPGNNRMCLCKYLKGNGPNVKSLEFARKHFFKKLI